MEEVKVKKDTFDTKMKNLKGEFNKIIWASKSELVKQTSTVIVVSLIIGAVVVSFDAVYAIGIRTFATLVLQQ